MEHRCARRPISAADPDATPMQLEESEEARRPMHRALPARVSKEEYDAQSLTHLLSGHGVDTV